MPSFTLNGPVAGSALAAAVGLQPTTLDDGASTQIATNIAAAAGAVNTPQSPAFSVQPRQGGGAKSLTVYAVGIGGTITTLTVNLLVSYDGGATWQVLASSGAMGGSPPVPTRFDNLPAGALFALAAATLVLGTATGVNLSGSVS